MTAPAIDRQGRCRACGQLVEEHDDQVCPATRIPGFAKRGRRPRRRQPDFVDVPLPGADQWNLSGSLRCWPSQHTDDCGCARSTVSNGEEATDRDDYNLTA